MIIDFDIEMKPKLFSQIFTIKVSMYNIINILISFFTRETVRSIALERVFVKQSFQYFIFKHGYRCAPFQIKRKVIPNYK